MNKYVKVICEYYHPLKFNNYFICIASSDECTITKYKLRNTGGCNDGHVNLEWIDYLIHINHFKKVK